MWQGGVPLQGDVWALAGRRVAYAAAKLAFELGEQVRGVRQERTWSPRDLAKLTGMTQSAVARFEAGGTTPTLPILERVANAFDTTMSVKLTPKAVA